MERAGAWLVCAWLLVACGGGDESAGAVDARPRDDAASAEAAARDPEDGGAAGRRDARPPDAGRTAPADASSSDAADARDLGPDPPRDVAFADGAAPPPRDGGSDVPRDAAPARDGVLARDAATDAGVPRDAGDLPDQPVDVGAPDAGAVPDPPLDAGDVPDPPPDAAASEDGGVAGDSAPSPDAAPVDPQDAALTDAAPDAAPPAIELCEGGADDDADGQVDCDDADCALAAPCLSCDEGGQGATDVGCGGPACPACLDDEACLEDRDCQSARCRAGRCAPATCDDGAANQGEADLDCGGPCPGCPPGRACRADPDCDSLRCAAAICAEPACDDERPNGAESDTDCGGPDCDPCLPGAACRDPADCVEGVCTDRTCADPACEDGRHNGREAARDCGGPDCPPCPDGSPCTIGPDCESGVCGPEGCAAPRCDDGVRNGDEAGADCGGACDLPCPPADPAGHAPPLDGGGVADFDFLLNGPGATQIDVADGALEPDRISVVRGFVGARDGGPLASVAVRAAREPGAGHTLTRADGRFDLVINGGGPITLAFDRPGYLPAHRRVEAAWGEIVEAAPVRLVPLDGEVTPVALGAAEIQVAHSTPQEDADGPRRATLLVPAGTTATMTLDDGSVVDADVLSVRLTEYTVGDGGRASMPADLPATSGYTYAVELSADEAFAAGASRVDFDRPLRLFVENFLGFPVGTAVPAGFYDRQREAWVASENGRVVAVVGVEAGLAAIDADGDDAADPPAELAALGLDEAALAEIARLYTPGQTLWAVPIPHFTPWDCNWPFGPPDDAVAPDEPVPLGGDAPIDEGDEMCGSVVRIQRQGLGESVAVAGTPFRLHYESERVPGRRATLELPLLGDAPLPASLRAVEVDVDVAGRNFHERLAARPGLRFDLAWDGRDAYGREVRGTREARVRSCLVYAAQYFAVSGDFQRSFGRFAGEGAAPQAGPPVRIAARRAGGEVALCREWRGPFERWLNDRDDLGGFTLDVHHAYDPTGRVLHLGDGRRRSADGLGLRVRTTEVRSEGGVAGMANALGRPIREVNLARPSDVAIAADGSLWIAATNGDNGVGLLRVDRDGVVRRVDQGVHAAVALAPDGSLYTIRQHAVSRVRREGGREVIAGGAAGFAGDGGPARLARFDSPQGLGVGPDGSLYVADYRNHRVRRIGTDGVVTTFAGTGEARAEAPGPAPGDGGPAHAAPLYLPGDVAVAADGTVYIADHGRVRRVRPDGVIDTFAGGGRGREPDVLATDVWLGAVTHLDVAPDGTVFIVQLPGSTDGVVWRVGGDGIIRRVTGGPEVSGQDLGHGRPAESVRIYGARGIARRPDGDLWLAQSCGSCSGWATAALYRIAPPLPGAGEAEILVPSADAAEVYAFDRAGRHVSTRATAGGHERYRFEYDGRRLAAVVDVDGHRTVVERDAAGRPVALVAWTGERTRLETDASGRLVRVTNAAGGAYAFTYDAGGLLVAMEDPRGAAHRYGYDARGRLVLDEGPAGALRLERDVGASLAVTAESAAGRRRAWRVLGRRGGTLDEEVEPTPGLVLRRRRTAGGQSQVTAPDGYTAQLSVLPDTRFLLAAPVPASLRASGPAQATLQLTGTRQVTLADPADVMSATEVTETLRRGALSFTSRHEIGARRRTHTSPAGRVEVTELDPRGRPVRIVPPGLAAVDLAWTPDGLLASVARGAARFELRHDAFGRVVGATDPLGRAIDYERDAAGRIVAIHRPGGRTTRLEWDPLDALTAVVPDGRPAHRVERDAAGRESAFTPPGGPVFRTRYDADGYPASLERPDGAVVTLEHDAVGRLVRLAGPEGATVFEHDPQTGNLARATGPGGERLIQTTDAGHLVETRWEGPVTGFVRRRYDEALRVNRLEVGAVRVDLAYDADGLTTASGGLTVRRDGPTGLVAAIEAGVLRTTFVHDENGAPVEQVTTRDGAPLHRLAWTRDALGRITAEEEQLGAEVTRRDYVYDADGRLVEVSRDGALFRRYAYDANGNRLEVEDDGGQVTRSRYDDQDRLLQAGEVTYVHAEGGDRSARRDGAAVTGYRIDALGNLRGVDLPDGRRVDYVVDPAQRRIGRRLGGAATHGWLYDEARPVAELSAAGAVASVFAYVDDAHAPAGLVRGGVWYRLLTDALGSPRAVVNAQTGAVVQRLAYDPYGRVLADTAPGFQPFGYGGGLADPDTGLVRFGARDYDPETGRWLTRDPIGFEGDGPNLYEYVQGDPINRVDPEGEAGPALVLLAAGVAYLYAAITAPGVANAPGPGDAIVPGPSPLEVMQAHLEGASLVLTPPVCRAIRRGPEPKLGGNVRIAPLGNATNHPLGRFPHYHRRKLLPDGTTVPGQGIGRHRPWEWRPTDRGFFDRF